MLSETLVVSNRTQGYQWYGGGLFVEGDCTMRKCQVVRNIPNATSRHYADGIYFDTGTLDMANCVVSSNGIPGSAGYGGGLWFYSGTGRVRNCVVSGNAHEGIRQEYGSLALVNCTITANSSMGVNGSGQTAVTNCIVYFNLNGGLQVGGTSSISYSDVQGGVQPGSGNISYAPALCPQNQSVIQGSPCIDAGSPATVFNDVCIDPTLCTPYSRGTLRNDMGAYGGALTCRWPPGNVPVIVTQPQSQTSWLGQTATFSVGASGSDPLSYQWFFKNVAMPGRTGSLLALTSLQSTNAGTYAVVVSNVFGSVTNAPAQLVVNDACVDICTYAGLNIAGLPGRTYELRYTTDLNNTNFATWTFLATNTTPWFYIDTTSCGVPKRFYGVKLRP